MSKLANQEIELFRAGSYPQGTFTEADLDKMVERFQSGHHDVPFVIGHPESTAPAYGWLASMKRDGKLLLGTAKEVNPTFEEMVKQGSFKKRSVELRKRTGDWVVTHVGWLGAQAPAIKGLADCKFEQDGAEASLTFEENLMSVDTEKTFGERMEQWFAEKFGAKGAGVTFTEADVRRISADASRAAVEDAVKPLQDQLKAATATFAERDTQLAFAETDARATAAIGKLKAEGKWVPAFDKAGLPLVFAELAKQTETVTFGEGDAKKTATPLDTLVSFMEQLPRIVPNAAVYNGQSAHAPTGAKLTGINDSARTPADGNSVVLHQFAERKASDLKIDYGTALTQAIAEHPELAVPGGASAGAV